MTTPARSSDSFASTHVDAFRSSRHQRFALKPLALALAAASMLSLPEIAVSPARAQAAASLPSGLNIVAGQASVMVNGQQMTVTNSANSILNWQSFSIGNNAGVYFAQPDIASKVLNRVVGNDPSAILGSLGSNGQVWLLNPNGVLFGQGARIDVGGLVTSTLRLNDIDWLSGRYAFSAAGSDPAAAIVNQGELRSSMGGRIALLGGQVRNEGLIDAPGGQVMLAAGRSIELIDTGTPNLRLRVTAPEGEALNLGTLASAGGRVDVHAAMVNQQGHVRADGIGVDAAGQVVLLASTKLDLAAGSVTSASGAVGGQLMLDSGAAGTTLIHGSVLAKGTAGAGGQVQVLGQQVGLLDAARIDVSGAAGGGQALIGGGREGKDPTVRNADGTYVGPQVQLAADATGSGDGGQLILWGNSATRAYGSFSALGGPLGGDGGFIETSGGWVDAKPVRIDASATKGVAGTWLLDPFYDITITDGAYGGSISFAPPGSYTSVGSNAQIDSATIRGVLNGGNNVVITTGSACSDCGNEPGDIFVRNANLAVSPPSAVSLSLNAARNIEVTTSTISSGNAPLGLSFRAGNSGSGAVFLSDTASLSTRGGNVDMIGTGFVGGPSTSSNGIFTLGTQINAGAGRISLTGSGTGTAGVLLSNGSLSAGRIELFGTDTSSNPGAGVSIRSANLSANSILIDGRGTSVSQHGVSASGATITGFHDVTIVGTSGQVGVGIDGGTVQVRPAALDASAFLRINGTSTSTNYGVDISAQYGGGLIASNGARIDVVGSHASGTLPSLNLGSGVSIGDSTGGNANFVGNSPAVFGANIHVGGRITLLADDVTIPLGGSLRSDATGDAIIIAGTTGPNTNTFVNNAGPGALTTPNGRWLIYGQNPMSLSQGGLNYNFKQYNARYNQPNPLTPATGNGLLYAQAPVVNLQADRFSKMYDGTTLASPLSNLIITGQSTGDQANFPSGPRGNFADKNVGFDKPISIAATDVTFTDSSGRPVLGYALVSNVRGDISRRNVALTGISAQNKPYDASVTATVTATGINGVVSGETLGTTLSGSFDTKDVGTAKRVDITAQLTDGPSGDRASNYVLSPQPTSTTADITRRQLTGSFSADNKVYDGNDLATVRLTGLGNLAAAETLNVSSSGTFDTKDAGIAKPVRVVVTLQDGTNGGRASNYAAPLSGATSADITPRPLTGNFSADNKVYDGNTVAALRLGSLTGLVGSETLGTSASGNFDTKDAGTAKRVDINVSGLSDGSNGGLARNYTITPTSTATADITPRPLTGNFSADNKVYDGNTVAALRLGSLTGLVGSETLGTSASGNFDTKDAGTAKRVDINVSGLSDGSNGGLARNYTITPTSTATADITPRPLTGSFSADNKVYDGNTVAALRLGSLTGLVGSETLGTSASGNFDTKDAGTAKRVDINVSGLSDGSNGGLARNYTITPTATATADITPRPLTGNFSADNKVYDGNTVASLRLGSLTGLVGSETLGTTASGNFDTKDAGTAKRVDINVSGLSDGSNGGLARNYTITPTATATADITPRPLTGNFSADNKVYDGNTVAALRLGSLTGLVGSETLGTSASGNFDTKDAGTAKRVDINVSGLSDGSNGGLARNYTITPTSTATADITPRPLTGNFSADNKVYDGNTVAALRLGSLTGLVGSETLGTSASGNFDTKDAGTAKRVDINVSGLSDGSNGGLARNYTITPTSTATADITPRPLTGNFSADNKVYDGNTVAALRLGSLTGLVGSETLGTSASGNFDTKDAGTAKRVDINVSGLSDGSNGGLARNYTITPTATATADITPRPLTGNFSADNKVYDGNTVAALRLGSLTGLVGSETLGTSASGNFDTKDAGTAKRVDINVSGLSDGSNGGLARNYTITPTATATADITPRPLTGNFSADNKVYDGNTLAAVTLGSLGGLVGTETLTITTGGNFNNKDAGIAKPVAVTVAVANGANGGLASNYVLPNATPALSASITPAPLTYTADPASKPAGAPLPALSGSVSGFVSGESSATATTGTLAFVTPATPSSPPGQFAITGTGLAAGNYSFQQAASNATALTVTGFVPVTNNVEQTSQVALNRSLALVSPQPVFSSPAEGRVFDVIQTLRGNYLGQGALFRAIPIDAMSQDSLTTLLAARDQYKKALFGAAIRQLEQNPGLADVSACKSAQEVDNGSCLITEDLKAQLKRERAAVRFAATPVSTPASLTPLIPAPAPTPAPTTPSTDSALAIPPAAPREGVGGAVVSEPVPVFGNRRVRTAALPQIERKIAIVIGVNRYSDRRMPQLENAVGDAEAVGKILEDRLGYETVILENATKASLVRALNRLAVELEPRDSVVIYYAGHGELIASTGLGYWQLSDSNPTRPETWMSNADISRMISKINADQVAVISDSCYSGSLVDERIRASAATVDPRQVLAKKSVVVMSSGGNEPVFDEGKNGHSPFAYNLMQNLQQVSNWQVGGNLFERVRFAVARQLPQRPLYGAAAAAGHQPGGDYLFEQRQLDK